MRVNYDIGIKADDFIRIHFKFNLIFYDGLRKGHEANTYVGSFRLFPCDYVHTNLHIY